MSRPEPALAASAVRDAAPLFAALGDETRLGLLLRLSADGPASIAHLGARARVSRQAVTKHLEVLAGAGLIRDSWRGRERIWEIERARFADALDYLERISRQWDAALARLKSFVEEESD
jgi:DNA-binding transcriptional ArsR family regulator